MAPLSTLALPGEDSGFMRLQALVFALVAAAFATVYITQPVLPVLQQEFGVTPSVASLTVSGVILGIALANLPFGMLADRYPVRLLILLGGTVVGACGFFCAATGSLKLLVAARFLQGLFIPALTTCLAAYLSRTLPLERLNVVMGSYVSATVAGGLSGRLLGGWIHPPLHWRYAFVTASLFLVAVSLAALRWLPPEDRPSGAAAETGSFRDILSQPELRRLFLVPFGGFFVFSSIFNYLPFYLSQPPFSASTQVITLLYLSYLLGIFTGPLSGRLSNRLGNGATIILGAAILALALATSLVPRWPTVVVALALVCTGHFAMHAAAAGSLNRKLTAGRGRANSIYVLAYYLGGAAGITLSGQAYSLAGWPGVVCLGLLVVTIPGAVGWRERRQED